ncbi:MAG: formylglycine-generating enzyme family protein [Gemmataceae bacterium]
MTDGDALLAAVARDPGDGLAWLALADALEEAGRPAPAELLRTSLQARALPADDPARGPLEERVVRLIDAGTAPPGPEVTNGLGMRLRPVPPGVFLMGAAKGERNNGTGDRPRHEVEISRPFWLGTTPVTQRQYEAVMGNNPSHFRPGRGVEADADTSDWPVESATWHEAVQFCGRLTRLPEEKKAKRAYRLPTEAEWEYAARGAGVYSTPYQFGRSLPVDWARFGGTNLDGRTCPVGRYPPSVLGLYDVHGNVWEWCADWFAQDYYHRSPRRDPPGAKGGEHKVLRGGSWVTGREFLRAACRVRNTPDNRGNGYGFRVACDIG